MTSQTKKWIAGAGGVVAAIMLATNPDQAKHLRAIKDTAALKPSQPLSVTDFMAGMLYNNYFFFSTVTLADGWFLGGPLARFTPRTGFLILLAPGIDRTSRHSSSDRGPS